MNLTLSELQEAQAEAIRELVIEAGSVAHLARMLKINHMTVKGWIVRKRISKAGVKLVISHSNLGSKFKAKYLRPDL